MHSAKEIAQSLAANRNILIMAGDLCSTLTLPERPLIDYAVALSEKLHAPIAATGNTAIHLDSTKVTFAKMWAAEVIDYMREGPVKPLTDKAPECVVLIGYHPYVAQRLIAGMNGTKSLVLCNSRIPGATLSYPDCSLREFETHLKSLINEISQNGTEGGKR